MENTTKTKGFYEYRTTLRAMSDGVSLLTKNATMLLKASWPLLLVVSLLGAWFICSLSVFISDIASGVGFSLYDLGIKLVLPSLPFFVGFLVFYALVFTLFSLYIEKGFIPLLQRPRFRLCPKVTKISRLLIGILWMVFIIVVYTAFSVVLVDLSKWTLIVLIPIFIIVLFWLVNQLVGYVLVSDTLMGSIRHSFGNTLKGLGSFLMVLVIFSLVLGLISIVCILPTVCSQVIMFKAKLSLAEGDNVSLPSYFMPVFFLASMLSTFLMLIISALKVSCWSMVYGAVDARIKQKKEETANHQS